MRPRKPAVTIREQQHGIAMHLPEAAQQVQRRIRQVNEAVRVAFGVADMHPLAVDIDITHLQAQAFFAESQTQARG